MTEYYKKGDILRHQTANRAEEAWELTQSFGSAHANKVKLIPGADMPPFSVVRLGKTSTPFSELLELKAADPITDGDGPCYTNSGIRSNNNGGNGATWWYPITLFHVKLRTKGTIVTGDRAFPNNDGEAEKGNGPLYCVSEIDSATAFFVQDAQPKERIWVFVVKNESTATVGSKTAECTLLYDVFLPSDMNNAILTNVNPTSGDHRHTRHGVGRCIPAKSGNGWWDADGNPVIADCNEKLATKACADSATGPVDPEGGTAEI